MPDKGKAVSLHRCRFPSWSPSSISTLALSPSSFDSATLNLGDHSAERSILAVGRSNGDIELNHWGGHQGWVVFNTLPSSFPLSSSSSKKPTTLLSHLLFTHQTTLSDDDMDLYSNDLEGAKAELAKLQRTGMRLFGVGGSASELVEWEWGCPGGSKDVGRIKSTLPTVPPIFALASTPSSSHLAISCEDSTIRILSILDGSLEIISQIDVGGPGKVRAISLAWGYPSSSSSSSHKDKEDESSLPSSFRTPSSTHLFAGLSNSTLRRYDSSNPSLTTTNSWRSTQRMTLDKHPGEQTVVWCLAVIPTLGKKSEEDEGETIVSGDSMGNVKIWDGKMGVQKQSFRNHKADVLTIAIGSTGTQIFSSGIDQKTCELKLVPSSTKSSSKWILSSGRRLHQHDVRSLIVEPSFSPILPSHSNSSSSKKRIPILTSGGLDFSLIIVPVSPGGIKGLNPISDVKSLEFETTIHRKCSYVPQRGRVFVSGGKGLLVGRRERGLDVWKVGGNGGGWMKIGEMELKVHTNLISHALSSDGRWLAVSDLYETKLFRISLKLSTFTPHRLKTFSAILSSSLPTTLGTGSSSLLFTSTNRLILATAFGGSVAVVKLPELGDEVKVERVWKSGEMSGGKRVGGREIKGLKVNGNGKENGVESDEESDEEEESDGMEVDDDEVGSEEERNAVENKIVTMGVSEDGNWLATSDLGRRIAVFNLKELKPFTTLPTPSFLPVSLSFIPSTSSSSAKPTLLLLSPTNSISLFSLSTLSYPSYSLPLSSPSTNDLMTLREPALGISFEPTPTVSKKDDQEEEEEEGRFKVHASRRARINGFSTGENGEEEREEEEGGKEKCTAVIWGSNWVGLVDLLALEKGEDGAHWEKKSNKKKRTWGSSSTSLSLTNGATEEEGREGKKVDIKIVKKFQPIVLLDFLSKGEMVVVERVWADLVEGLPEAWTRNGVFGT